LWLNAAILEVSTPLKVANVLIALLHS